MMDRRVAKSRKAIFEAFESMLAKKPYAKITVDDILREADVGRSTFYAHFETKDALLGEICSDLFDHVVNTGLAEGDHDFSNDSDVDDIMTHLLYHLREQRERLAPLFESSSANLFWSHFSESLGPLVTQHIEHWRDSRNAEVPDALLKSHVITTFVETAKWWYADGLKASPEQVEELFASLV